MSSAPCISHPSFKNCANITSTQVATVLGHGSVPDHMYISDPVGTISHSGKTNPDQVYNIPNSMYTNLDPKCTIPGPM